MIGFEKKEMGLLVTGGAGFIGSNFIRYMLQRYPRCSIINLDKLTYAGNSKNLRDVEDSTRYFFQQGDICDRKAVDKLVFFKPDAIINFAAESHVDRSITDPQEFLKTNVLGTYVLLEAAKKHSIKRFIQISTDEVYGSITGGSFTEKSRVDPNSPYSASKANADLLAMAYHRTYGLPVIITRSSNNFGPYQYPEKLIPLFVTNLLEGKKVPVYGDGQQIRDWLYVIDNCRAIDFILHHGQVGEVYNIGANSERTNLEITEIILKQLGKDESCIEHVEDRLGHDRRYSLDCGKLKRLGWSPGFKFKRAMTETIKWYMNNQDWWQPLKKEVGYE